MSKSEDSTIVVEFDKSQLAALSATLQMVSPNTQKAIWKRIKPAGQIIVDEIKRRTPVGATGKLKRGTGSRVGKDKTSVRIVNTATSSPWSRPRKTDNAFFYPAYAGSPKRTATGRGYRYGKRLEFDAATYKGRYRFFYPGFEAKKAEAVRELDKILEDVGRGFSIGGA